MTAVSTQPPQRISARPQLRIAKRHDRDHAATDLAGAVAIFAALRGMLFGIAYRMLGTVADAEDIVQDTWVRWQSCDRGAVLDPQAFLATTTTRLCINTLQSAHARRETYLGPWLPEPVDTSADPLLGAERNDDISFAVMVLLEKLPPAERAAYVLREAFNYPYAQIASIIGVSEPNARQLATRARKHVSSERSEAASTDSHRQLLKAIVSASRSGDLATLERQLAIDINP